MNQEQEKVEAMPTVTDEQYRVIIGNVPENFRISFDPDGHRSHHVFTGPTGKGMRFFQSISSDEKD